LADDLLKHLRDKQPKYATNHLFIPFGEDFRYSHAEKNYQNMDRMIEFMNKYHGDEFILRYSTPSNYIDELKKLDTNGQQHIKISSRIKTLLMPIGPDTSLLDRF